MLSKVFPTRSHTVAAQGGISASLGNIAEDHWHWHMYDTVKGSDWLGDQDAIEFMCRKAPQVVYELEHLGMPFSRTPTAPSTSGRSAATRRTSARAPGSAHAPPPTAPATRMLHTLYQRNVRAHTQFFVEWIALDLIATRTATCSASPRSRWRPARS